MRATFNIPGKPFAKQRPRFSRQSGRAYTPGETVKFEQTVGEIAVSHFPAPMEGPIGITITATFKPPPSWSKKKVAAHLGRPHTQKPDLDNIEKAILDGLNRIAFADDAQVYAVTKIKMWGQVEQTAVIVESIG